MLNFVFPDEFGLKKKSKTTMNIHMKITRTMIFTIFITPFLYHFLLDNTMKKENILIYIFSFSFFLYRDSNFCLYLEILTRTTLFAVLSLGKFFTWKWRHEQKPSRSRFGKRVRITTPLRDLICKITKMPLIFYIY